MTEEPKEIAWAISLHRVEDKKLVQLSVRYAEGEPWTGATRVAGFASMDKETFMAACLDLWTSTMRVARAGNIKEILPQQADEELAK